MKFVNLDDAQSIFFEREVERVKARTFDVKFPLLKARTVIPVSFEAPSHAESIVYQQFENKGKAKIIANYAGDLPRADIVGKEFTGKVRPIGASYGWNIQELRLSIASGKALNQRRATACKRAILQTENAVAWFGDANYGLIGLLTEANVAVVALPTDGSGSATTFASKTPDFVVRDIVNLCATISDQSKGVEAADTLLLPITQYNDIANRQRSIATDTTVLEWILKTIPGLQNVEWVNELKNGNAAGNKDVMLAYKRDPEKLVLEVPQDFEQFPVQEKGLEFVVNCHMRTGGITVHYPLSIAKSEGI